MVDWDLVNTGYVDNDDYNSSERAGDREDSDMIRGLTLRGQINYAKVRPAHTATCRKCGARELGWRQHASGRWWLTSADGGWHTCHAAIL